MTDVLRHAITHTWAVLCAVAQRTAAERRLLVDESVKIGLLTDRDREIILRLPLDMWDDGEARRRMKRTTLECDATSFHPGELRVDVGSPTTFTAESGASYQAIVWSPTLSQGGSPTPVTASHQAAIAMERYIRRLAEVHAWPKGVGACESPLHVAAHSGGIAVEREAIAWEELEPVARRGIADALHRLGDDTFG